MPDDVATVSAGLALRLRTGVRQRENWLQLARFCVVGASGYALNLAVFAFSVHELALDYRIAATLAFLVAVTSNFWWNRRWTFPGSNGRVAFQAWRFLAISALAFLVNIALLDGLVRGADVPKLAAQAIAVLAVTPFSFLANKLWSFRA